MLAPGPLERFDQTFFSRNNILLVLCVGPHRGHGPLVQGVIQCRFDVIDRFDVLRVNTVGPHRGHGRQCYARPLDRFQVSSQVFKSKGRRRRNHDHEQKVRHISFFSSFQVNNFDAHSRAARTTNLALRSNIFKSLQFKSALGDRSICSCEYFGKQHS